MLENNKIRRNRTASTSCLGAPSSSFSDPFFSSSENGITDNSTSTTQKRKRRPAGTPDPDAVVISLSPKTLLESDRYICDICNQGFQRDQNLQMHRRRHKVPWKLLKRETNKEANKKRVYVCPEPSCVHHDPSHALGDLVGIKKHYRRKHSTNKQWVCDKCNKGYAVQSDYKAHLKTCGTRGHSCDCGRVFSRVESFIEHQDSCSSRRVIHSHHRHPQDSSFNNLNITAPLVGFPVTNPTFQRPSHNHQNLEILQLLPVKTCETDLRLSMEEVGDGGNRSSEIIAMAEMEFANARRIRKQAQEELEKARVLEDEIMKVTYCRDCRRLNVK